MLAPLLLLFAGLLGEPVPDWPAKPVDQWVQGGPLSLASLRGHVVLLRFFTGQECPYCSATAPALNAFHREFAPRGLVVVGLYTPKPRPRPVPMEEARAQTAAYGFSFPVAIDADWGALRKLWLDRVQDAGFTSASLLLDREGRLRHVHPGGAFAEDSKDPEERREYAAMRKAILQLLAEPPKKG
jgi:peroxiredoxin